MIAQSGSKNNVIETQSRGLRPILVTGSHRSGSTWVGKMLDLSFPTYYLGEIFSPATKLLNPDLLRYWFRYVPLRDGCDHVLYEPLSRLLALDFRWPNRSGLRRFLPSRLILLKHANRWFGVPRLIVKDPIAVLSSEWLAEVFNMDVLCLIRHPAAFVYSLIRANWDFGFSQFIEQRQLMEDWLYPFESQIGAPPRKLVERGALLWLCIYYVLTNYIQNHPEWSFRRLEDISTNPLAEFGSLYEEMNLKYTRRIRRQIWEYSNPQNPVESPPGNTTLLRRNSRDSQDIWRKVLTSDQVRRIRAIVEPLSSQYYLDSEW